MPTKKELVDSIKSQHDTIIAMLKDNINMMNNPAKLIALWKHLKYKDLQEINNSLKRMFKEAQKITFRKIF